MDGRVVLITGATGHIGKVASETMAELNADLVLTDLDTIALDSLRNHLIQLNNNISITTIQCNLEIEVERNYLINKILTENIPLTSVINNAAYVGSSDLIGWNEEFSNQSLDSWNRAIEVNLTAPFHLVQKLSPLLLKSQSSSVVNIASIYADLGPDWRLYENLEMSSPAAYSISKGGLVQLTRWLSTTLAPTIRVNAISPGGIYRNQSEKFLERYISKTPLQRMAKEEDMRGALAFLISDMSSYVTGQVLKVDGGFSVW